MFYDLCISDKMEESDLQLVLRLGYKTLAINKDLDESIIINTKRKGRSIDTRENVDLVPECTSCTAENNSGITLLNRLTIQIGDIALLSKLNQSENIKKYDIVAVIPTTQAAFSHACTAMEVDIICFAPEHMANCKINRKLYKQAVERGIYFEISYAKALKDSTYRRSMIQRAHLYHTIGKSLNILVTSGAENYYQVRAPYDVINLGKILGLNDSLSMRSVTEGPKKVLLKADSRRRGKAAVFFFNGHPTELEMEASQAKKIKLV